MLRHTVALATLFACCSATAFAAGLSVPIDQGKIMSFGKPVATIYLANPAIADVNIIDGKRIYVLGKTFGTSNLLALDAKGKVVFSGNLSVDGPTGKVVTLNLGHAQQSYACNAGRCAPAPLPGDDSGYYAAMLQQGPMRASLEQQAAQPK